MSLAGLTTGSIIGVSWLPRLSLSLPVSHFAVLLSERVGERERGGREREREKGERGERERGGRRERGEEEATARE